MKRILGDILTTALLLVIAAVAIITLYQHEHPAPCSQTIYYDIGSFDPRFGISKSEFLADTAKAVSAWNQAGGKTLLAYSATGSLAVNLVYDYREQATMQMEKLGLSIDNGQASYTALKAKYTSLESEYATRKAAIDSLTKAYESAKSSYESQVAYWNAHGGAPQAQYQELQKAQSALNAQAATLNEDETSLNQLVSTINSAAVVLNELAHELNGIIENYNAIGSSTGESFDEGEYSDDSSGPHIDIYQFTDENKLVRVLEHEFGHSLGLSHVSDPAAVMYYLNQGTNTTLTSADRAELQKVCMIY